VAAALLTQSGFSGPHDIIEGAGGFARAYAGEWDPTIIERGLGERFHLLDTLVKSHAAAARVAAGIDGMLELRRQHGFHGDDIAAIQLGIPRIIEGRLTHPHPVDLQAAQMSLPFSVALAAKVRLTPGAATALTVGDYEAGLSDRTVFAIEDRTTCELDGEVEAFSDARSTAARVRVRLCDGRAFSLLVTSPKGSPSRPFSAEEHEARFEQELTSRISKPHCAEIIAMARNLDRLDVSRVCEMLCGV
jgi:2-methylcitrate dehydratase PrpD